MHGHAVILAAALAWFISSDTAEAKLDILVDKATQRMLVIQDGYVRYMWPVSTGRDNMQTPNGSYAPQRLERNWFSSAYYDSPMPFSIFFHHGYAIHGSYAIDRLGGPASHGCVRLHPHHAAILFDLVQQEGVDRTTIEITDQGRPAERSSIGREMPPPGGMNPPPAPKLIRYPEGTDMPDFPPPPRSNRPLIVKNGPPPPRPAMVASRLAPDVGPRAPIGATEADAANSPSRLPKEYPGARSKPPVIEAPKAIEAPKVIEAPKIAEGYSPEMPQPAAPASSFKLLPASCWSGGASRWQWWASSQQNPCR